jgi:anti-anti-sigma factor
LGLRDRVLEDRKDKTLDLAAEIRDDVTIIHIRGRITIAHVDDLQLFLTDLLSEETLTFVLDLDGLTHIVSSGIGTLIAFRERVLKRDGILAMSNINPRIRKIFNLMCLDSFFPLYDTVEQALTYLKDARAGS